MQFDHSAGRCLPDAVVHCQVPQHARRCPTAQPANPISTHIVRSQPRQRVKVGAVSCMCLGVACQRLRLIAQPGRRRRRREEMKMEEDGPRNLLAH